MILSTTKRSNFCSYLVYIAIFRVVSLTHYTIAPNTAAFYSISFVTAYLFILNPQTSKGVRVVEPPPPVGFFSLKFLSFDQLPNSFAQLFLDNGLSDVSIDDVIILINGK